MRTLRLAVLALPIMFVLDLLWIGVLASGFYRSQLGQLLSLNVIWPAALLFYGIYAIALAYFVIAPAIASRSLARAGLTGALFGLASYAAYDLTNLATIVGWPLSVTIIDMVWGVFCSAVVSMVVYLLADKVFRWQ